jgi:cell shape-determining protein MreC
LNDERSLFENQNEKYKKELSEQIKKYKNTQLINTPIVEEKYNLWQRILKTLGMN